MVQVLQSLESHCSNPMMVIYYIAPPSAIVMTPAALLEVILKHNESGPAVTTVAIAEVAILILGAGLFSFMLIFAEVRFGSSLPSPPAPATRFKY